MLRGNLVKIQIRIRIFGSLDPQQDPHYIRFSIETNMNPKKKLSAFD
jgi:hypothetical protein